MRTLRLSLLTAAFLVLTAGSASALVLRQPSVEILRGNPVVSAHVARNSAALEQCATLGRAGTVKAHVRIHWNGRGLPRSITVKGGTVAFRRCAKEALDSRLPIVRRRAGSGSATFIVR